MVALVVVAAALAAGYFGWFRDSSLVAIDKVTVKGVGTSDAERVTEALTASARGMTTLHVRQADLERAVAGFPTVAGVEAEAGFPDSITITVAERRPALMVASPKATVPAAADGTLLTGLEVSDEDARSLPTVGVDELPASERLEGGALQQALVAGAAPAPLRPLIEDVSLTEPGVELILGGIEVRFGSASSARRKWAAAAAVLADPKLTSATYVDVRVPERPAVGGAGEDAVATDPAEAALTDPTAVPAG